MIRPFFSTFRPARAAAFFLTAALLSGCATFGTGGLVASTAPAELSAPAASAVAGDLVPRLAEQIGQRKATIVLKPDGSAFESHPARLCARLHGRTDARPPLDRIDRDRSRLFHDRDQRAAGKPGLGDEAQLRGGEA